MEPTIISATQTTNDHTASTTDDPTEKALAAKVASAARIASGAGEFKAKAFEIILQNLLAGGPTPAAKPQGQPGAVHAATTPLAVPGTVPKGFEAFLQSNALAADKLAGIMDFETGQVIALNLGKSNSERQRRLAAMLGLWHMSKDGTMLVPQEELVANCKNFSCYDSNNFAANMAAAKTKDSRSVFVKLDDGTGWKVSAPGASFVTETIRLLLGEPQA